MSEANNYPSARKLLFDSIKTEKTDIVIVFIYAVVIGLLYLTTPLAVQELVNIIAFGVVLQPLFILTGLVVLGLLLVGIFRIFQRYLVETLQQRLFVKTSFELIEQIKSIKKGSLGNKQINLFFEVLALQKSYSKLLIDGLSAALQAGVGFIVLGLYHPYFLFLDIFLFIAILLAIFLGGKGGVKTSLKESHYKYELVHSLQETASCHDVFKLLGNTDFLFGRTDAINLKYLDARSKHFKVIIRQNILSLILQTLASGSLLALGGWLVINGNLTLGQLIAAELVVTAIVAAVDKFVGQIEVVYDLFTALVKLDFLKSLPHDESQGNKQLTPNQKGLRVECKNLFFSYNRDNTSRNILKGFNLQVEAGEWIHILGSRGEGKSTILLLIAGLYDSDKGSIYLNDLEIKEINIQSIGQSIGLVRGGNNLIFEGTLEENILLGREAQLPLRKILQISGLEDLVSGMPLGLKTQIESKGENLSESQIVRVLIARAITSSPALVLIDEEAFGSLESELKQNILKGLAEQMDFRPTVIIVGNEDSLNSWIQTRYNLENGLLVRV
jgi:ABC-type bacteriocin/lantibiotic exporter with double-glycine peptidase domain